MSELIERLKEAAQKATPGPWDKDSDFGTAIIAGGKTIASILNPINATKRQHPVPTDLEEVKANAALIALCSPDNILSLIEQLAASRAENEGLRAGLREIVATNQIERRRCIDFDPAGSTYEIGWADGPLAVIARAALSQKETGR